MNKFWKTAIAPLALCLCAVLAFSACSDDSSDSPANSFVGDWRQISSSSSGSSTNDQYLSITNNRTWSYYSEFDSAEERDRRSGSYDVGQDKDGTQYIICTGTYRGSAGYDITITFMLELNAFGDKLSGEKSISVSNYPSGSNYPSQPSTTSVTFERR